MLQRTNRVGFTHNGGIPYRDAMTFPSQGTLAERRRKTRDNSIAMALMQSGATIRAVAELFDVSTGTVHKVKMKYLGQGIE